MNTCTDSAVRVGLTCAIASAAVFWSAAANGASAESVCARLAAQINGASAAVMRKADLDDRGLQRWITYPAVRLPHDTEVYRRVAAAWRIQFPREPGSAPPLMSVEALQGTGLFVANTTLGSDDCLAATFIDWQPGGPVRVIGGPQLPVPPCGRAGAWAGIARVMGRPAYVETAPVDSTNTDSVRYVMLWSGHAWRRPCAVSIRYAYSVRQLYCRAAARVCDAARGMFPDLGRRYHRYSLRLKAALNGGAGALPTFHPQGAADAQGRALLSRARRLGISRRLVPAGEASASGARHFSPVVAEFFPLRLEGALYLSAAVHSQHPSAASRRRHWLFVLFDAPRASSRQLVPLAAFTVHRSLSAQTSIGASDEAASPGPGRSRP
ncbi:MAG: hypothetical protein ACYCT1_04495 [Steroidobacteraceae bacterium]